MTSQPLRRSQRLARAEIPAVRPAVDAEKIDVTLSSPKLQGRELENAQNHMPLVNKTTDLVKLQSATIDLHQHLTHQSLPSNAAEPIPRKRKRQVNKTNTPNLAEKSTPAKVPGNTTSGGQLYGNPPEGTIIQWGSRTCKQPKIYAVPDTPRYSKPADSLWHESAAQTRIAANTARIRKLRIGEVETRLKAFQDSPPDWFAGHFRRARTDRMYILQRERGFEEDCHAHHDDCPFETVHVAGASGNVYTVRISHLPSCTCPVGIFTKNKDNKLCKHILYVLHFVLKAPDSHLYQAAFLTAELKELFARAPPLNAVADDPSKLDDKRKPIDGDCPICFTEFDLAEEIVWCQALCGNNIHEACFDQWARGKSVVTCPFCRSNWGYPRAPHTHELAIPGIDIAAGSRARGGYSNVMDQLTQHSLTQG